jgi:penicillin-binding protein 2
MAKRFGLGAKLDFELPEERGGLMPTTQWKKQNLKDIWHPGESIVCSIGQGYVQATPLQLAVMTARMVNGGYAVKPWVTGYVGDDFTHDEPWEKIGVKHKNLELMMKGMDRVVNMPGGTAMGRGSPKKAWKWAARRGRHRSSASPPTNARAVSSKKICRGNIVTMACLSGYAPDT